MSDFIENKNWSIPEEIASRFPVVCSEVQQTVIPLMPSSDQLVWQVSNSGDLSFKDAYSFLNPSNHPITWGKVIWSNCVPPSKSFLCWRLLHNKMPCDDNLCKRGCNIVSMCSLCGVAVETSDHLFLNCAFVQSIWNWLSSILQCNLDLSSFNSILTVCSRNWSSQVSDIVSAAVINSIWVIWKSRNSSRFENKVMSFNTAISLIKASVSLSGNQSAGHMSSSISEFTILKYFKVEGRASKAPSIKQVIWHPLQFIGSNIILMGQLKDPRELQLVEAFLEIAFPELWAVLLSTLERQTLLLLNFLQL